ncbi:hypothetical protein EKE94_18070 [Mesobaculum littorinae]|uniref:STAS domain-containing protein n=1 Tax=Mesobaculum littorinae TaxID=2486419 RepID=A0A438ACY6_9RHOB|nr:NDP-sugar synthase [Mesobaculum littorinae]RVV96553.1 hypothetical protein EKE94_18070 [Mesobaculum littorinae]
MLFTVDDISPRLMRLRLSGGVLRMSAFASLARTLDAALSRGIAAAILDLAAVTGCTAAGSAALVELYATYGDRLRLAFCGLDAGARGHLRRAGLDETLPLYARVDLALADPAFRGLRLAGRRAVVLCGGAGAVPMGDVLGRPVLGHLLRHLAGFGISDVLIDAADPSGDPEGRLPGWLPHRPDPAPAVFLCEAAPAADAAPGSLAALARIARRHAAFAGDTFVLRPDALSDIDLGAMAAWHRRQNAAVTLAALRVPDQPGAAGGLPLAIDAAGRVTAIGTGAGAGPGAPGPRLADAGIYLIRADVLERVLGGDPIGPGLAGDNEGDIAADLIPRLIAAGETVGAFRVPFRWHAVMDGLGRQAAATAALTGALPGVVPTGERVRPGLWIAPGARISPLARLSGPCHIGEGAVIEAGAVLRGPCAVGAGAVIGRRARISRCLVEAGTRVAAGSRVADAVLSPEARAALPVAADARAALPRVADLRPNSPIAADLRPTPSVRRHVAATPAADRVVVAVPGPAMRPAGGVDPAANTAAGPRSAASARPGQTAPAAQRRSA